MFSPSIVEYVWKEPGRLRSRGLLCRVTVTQRHASVLSGSELKFLLHHGKYIVRSVAGHRELLGPDVTISHLLLKNHVADLTARSAY
jgi:hypothetical protein